MKFSQHGIMSAKTFWFAIKYMINVINMINPSHHFHIDNNAPCIPYPAPPPPPKKNTNKMKGFA